mgnify:CR=1 FL=1
MGEEIVEVPIDEPQETTQEAPETTPEVETDVAIPRAKARGRPKGVKDTKPRAKPKARAPPRPPQPASRIPADPSDSEESIDEATLHEASLTHLLRGVQQYRHTQKNQKTALYASWFGR